jgi:hypothetical protein
MITSYHYRQSRQPRGCFRPFSTPWLRHHPDYKPGDFDAVKATGVNIFAPSDGGAAGKPSPDKLPEPGNWKPIVEALRQGDYFVTSGEVLIPHYAVGKHGSSATISADVEWTFPLEFLEIVWGDGKRTGRQIIPATDLPPFGARHFELPFDLAGKSWVRFAVWDSAGNGALVQPVKTSALGK